MGSDILIPAEQRVKVVERADGLARLIIFSKRPGVYQFGVETDWNDDWHVWKEMSVSGFYGSVQEAEHDAEREVPWFRDQHTSQSYLGH